MKQIYQEGDILITTKDVNAQALSFVNHNININKGDIVNVTKVIVDDKVDDVNYELVVDNKYGEFIILAVDYQDHEVMKEYFKKKESEP